MEKGKDFIAYSLAVDEGADVTDTAQLSIFIRGVDSSLCITEELLGIKSMHSTTTGKYIFEEVSKCVNEMTNDETAMRQTDGIDDRWSAYDVRSKERISGEDAGEDAAGELCR